MMACSMHYDEKTKDEPTQDTQMHERKYQHHVHLHVVAEASHSAIQVMLTADLHGFGLNAQQVDLARRQEAVKMFGIRSQLLKWCQLLM